MLPPFPTTFLSSLILIPVVAFLPFDPHLHLSAGRAFVTDEPSTSMVDADKYTPSHVTR